MSYPPNISPYLAHPFIGSVGTFVKPGASLVSTIDGFINFCNNGTGAGNALIWSGGMTRLMTHPAKDVVFLGAYFDPLNPDFPGGSWTILFVPAPYCAASHPLGWSTEPVGWAANPSGGVQPV